MKKLTIEVTKEDILKGRQGNANSCAIARAARRQGFKSVSVDGTIEVTEKGKTFEGQIPVTVNRWIERFDDASTEQLKKLKPFSFSVTLKPVNG